jgi:hypothetical protein
MAVVDELVVALKLDPTNLDEEQKKALSALQKFVDEAEKKGAKLEKQNKSQAESFGTLSQSALKYFGILAGFIGLGSIEQLIKSTAAAEVTTGRFANILGQSTEQLSIWEGALQRNQGAASDADSAFNKLSETLYDIQVNGNGANPAIGILTRLGINPADLKDANSLLLELAGASQKTDRAQFTNLMRQMGFSDPMIAFLEKGQSGVQGELDRQKKIGYVTKDDAKNAADFQASLAEMSQSFAAMARILINYINPWLTPLAKSLGGEQNAIDWQHLPKWLGGDGVPQAPASGPRTNAYSSEMLGEDAGTSGGVEDTAFAAMVRQESRGRQFRNGKPIKSSAGAIGIAQVMEGTGRDAARLAGVAWDRNKWLNDADYNLKIGKAYWHWLYNRYGGDLSKAMAAYNAGFGTVDKAVNYAHNLGRDGNWGDYMRLFQSAANANQTRDYVNGNLARMGAGPTTNNINVTVVSPSNDPHVVGKAVANSVKASMFNYGMM